MFRQRLGLSLSVLALVPVAALAAAAAQSDEDAGFVPVTDAMLEDPAPGDWLMWRRTQNGWGYSPLDQVNRDNVGDLQLVWTRALAAGAQEGTPLAYGGVLFMRQYVVASTGTRTSGLTPDLRPSAGNNLFVFALPERDTVP